MIDRSGFFWAWLLATSVVVLLGTGCGSIKSPVIAYGGAELPDSQVARIKVQEGLQVLAVDDQRYKAPYVPDHGYEVHVKPGDHLISVYYSELWGDATDATSIASNVFHFRLDFKAGQIYEIQHNAPLNKMEPKDFPLKFTIWMRDPAQTEQIEAASTSKYGTFVNRGLYGLGGVDTSGGLPAKGGTPDSVTAAEASASGGAAETAADEVADDAAADTTSGVAAAAATGAAVAGTSAAAGESPSQQAAASAGEGGRHITILDELKAVWAEAAEEDKTEFRKWIIDNP